MNKVIKYIKTRRIGWWICLGAAVCALLELIIYLTTGTNSFNSDYSVPCIVGVIIGFVFAVASLVMDNRIGAFAAYVILLYGFIGYVASQINLISNILYGVDGTLFPASLLVGLIFAALAFVLALVAGILLKPKAKESACKVIMEGEKRR